MFPEVGSVMEAEVKFMHRGHAIVEFDCDWTATLPYTYAKSDFAEGDRITVLVTSREDSHGPQPRLQVEEV
jgi:hypothetical protein